MFLCGSALRHGALGARWQLLSPGASPVGIALERRAGIAQVAGSKSSGRTVLQLPLGLAQGLGATGWALNRLSFGSWILGEK